MRDKIIQQVIAKIKNRSDVGFKKYKVTLNDDNQSLDVWLNHLQEELMDAVNYIEKARSVLQEEIEECYVKDLKAKDSESISLYPETEYWTTNHTNEI